MELSFADAFTLWWRTPFPSPGSTSELNALRADLGEADEDAMVVDAFVQSGRFRLPRADVLAELEDVFVRADAFCTECSGKDLQVAREIRAYAALLTIVYKRYLEVGEGNSVGPDV